MKAGDIYKLDTGEFLLVVLESPSTYRGVLLSNSVAVMEPNPIDHTYLHNCRAVSVLNLSAFLNHVHGDT